MVYNPKKDKPVKFYNDIETALFDADSINLKEGEDILVLKVVAKVETDNVKILKSETSSKEVILVD
jgi:hypothetical protein